jgi:hypothetical protein
VSARASYNFDLGGPVFSVRAGGAHLFGDAPYFEWPQIGGSELLRGYVEDRFTGRSALWGGAHLRARLADFFAFFPGTLGLTTLADVGRVFEDADASSRWHAGYGGGLWISLVRADLLMNLNVVRSREGTGFYVTLRPTAPSPARRASASRPRYQMTSPLRRSTARTRACTRSSINGFTR